MTLSLPVHFHQGKTLIDVSNTYPTILKAVLEAVQNGIDNDGMHIAVRIDQQKRKITVTDDGEGASEADVTEALQNVNDTLKNGTRKKSKSGRIKIGRYGKGLFAPLTKCQSFSFISSRKGVDRYLSFSFNQSQIRGMRDQVLIHGERYPNMVFEDGVNTVRKYPDAPDVRVVDWATCVTFRDFVTDRMINNITCADDVIKEVFKNFGRLMHDEGIVLSVTFVAANGTKDEKRKIAAPKFSGTALGRELIYIESARHVFEMYLAPKDEKGKPAGQVLVGMADDPFAFSFKEFADSVSPHRGLLRDEVREALLSGHFEGEIRSSAARLHENRDKFAMNENVLKLCEAIHQWFDEIGSEHIQRLESVRKNERYQKLGRESMQTIEQMLKANPMLGELMQEFQEGTIGHGHTAPEAEQVVGKQDDTSVSTSGSTASSSAPEDGSKKTKSKAKKKPVPKGANPDHHPMTVVGPSGSKRTIVKESSLGLQIVHDVMETDDRLWVLDSKQGVLFFNIRHPVWVLCDGQRRTAASDRRVKQLQETVAIIALQWLFAPDEQKALYLQTMEDFIDCQTFLYQKSPSFNPGMKV